MRDRFIVETSFTPHVGWCSMIVDTKTRRRILVAGIDHETRAAKRAEQENSAWRSVQSQSEKTGER